VLSDETPGATVIQTVLVFIVCGKCDLVWFRLALMIPITRVYARGLSVFDVIMGDGERLWSIIRNVSYR